MFIRVKDKSTGHEFDVPESDPRIGKAFKPLSKNHYPPSAVARRPKHHTGRAPAPVTTEPSGVAEEPEKENENDADPKHAV